MKINGEEITGEEFAKRFIACLNAGLRQMTEKAAANNESLVIGHLDGTSSLVPAKELLKTLPKK